MDGSLQQHPLALRDRLLLLHAAVGKRTRGTWEMAPSSEL